MANGKLVLGKQSGGTLGLVFPDGVSNTEVVLPESGELVTKDYVDTGAGVANAKQDTITGGATTITTSNLTASRALMSDANGKVAVSAVTSTELKYLSGVTSSVQAQLNAKQATLVSGTNIKTINGTSILGSGDITISASPTTAQVGTATAGLGAGAVGSYGFFYALTGATSFGGTLAGSNLRPVGINTLSATNSPISIVDLQIQNTAQPGTWRCMGYNTYTSSLPPYLGVTLWLRIS